MSEITWLHLSDLHFHAKKFKDWDQDSVVKALKKDIENQGLEPDLIFVTGDIAFSGTEQDYALAQRFFEQLLGARLKKSNLFVVPGNHDVNRSLISVGARAMIQSIDKRQTLYEILKNEMDRQLLLLKMQPFHGFINKYFTGLYSITENDYYYAKTVKIGNSVIAVHGLNSALLSMDDDDQGRLAMGEFQVRQALEQVKNADIRIALMHHPFEWLQQFDRDFCEPLLLDKCDFILHGHLHRSGIYNLQTPDANAMILQAGACYESRESINCYNWVRFDPDTGSGSVFLRRYSDQQAGFWTKDTSTYKNIPDGEFTFQIPQTKSKIKPKAKSPAVPITDPSLNKKIECDYLRWMLKNSNSVPHSIIDPRAGETTGKHVIELSRLYIALQTKTAVPVEGKRKRSKDHPKETVWIMENPTRLISALEAASTESRVVFLGDPGSGKTTFINYLALCMSVAGLQNAGERVNENLHDLPQQLLPTWKFGFLLPLKVVLRDFAQSEWCDGSVDGLLHFIEENLTANAFAEFMSVLLHKLRDGGVLVLLDGLDEVADIKKRQIIRDAITVLASAYNNPRNRYIATCRIYAYRDICCRLTDFTDYTLAPFNLEQIDSFITHWYIIADEFGWRTKSDARELSDRLKEYTSRPELNELASNPLQLAMMTSLQFSWGCLPEDRVQLYQQMVDLLLVRWQQAKLSGSVGMPYQVEKRHLESALERVAFIVHHSQPTSSGTADIDEATLVSVFKDILEGDWSKAREMVDYIEQKAGLLIARDKGIYSFPHRSYQEYLAGCHLAIQPDFPDQMARLVHENYGHWRETALWAIGVMARLKNMVHVAVDAAAALCPCEPESTELSELLSSWQFINLAGEALLEAGLKDIRVQSRYILVLQRVRTCMEILIKQGALPPKDRAQIGRTFGKIGDPRFNSTLFSLPDEDLLGFIDIPAGPFFMGNTEQRIKQLHKQLGGDIDWYKWETPEIELNLPAFFISRYPVTNSQFKAFIDDGGYKDKKYWTEALAARRWRDGKIKVWTYIRSEEYTDKSENYGVISSLPNLPVVAVSWYEAMAYARWLNEKLKNSPGTPESLAELLRSGKWIVTLPSEAQWEKAARGSDRRIFPWSDEPDPVKANYAATGIGTATAVGLFPSGAGPYGCMDMAGNVWEWCRSQWTENYRNYQHDNYKRESLDKEVTRVLRGGACSGSPWCVRCAARLGDDPCSCGGIVGFRVVVSPFYDSDL